MLRREVESREGGRKIGYFERGIEVNREQSSGLFEDGEHEGKAYIGGLQQTSLENREQVMGSHIWGSERQGGGMCRGGEEQLHVLDVEQDGGLPLRERPTPRHVLVEDALQSHPLVLLVFLVPTHQST